MEKTIEYEIEVQVVTSAMKRNKVAKEDHMESGENLMAVREFFKENFLRERRVMLRPGGSKHYILSMLFFSS